MEADMNLWRCIEKTPVTNAIIDLQNVIKQPHKTEE